MTLGQGDTIVLYREPSEQILLLYLYSLGEEAALLVMTPDGYFDGPDRLLQAVWMGHEGGVASRIDVEVISSPWPSCAIPQRFESPG